MINLVTGEFVLHEEDIFYDGPIPFRWTRNIFSFVEREDTYHKHWHFNYDQYVEIDEALDSFFWQNDNGNILEMPYLSLGDEAVLNEDKIIYRHTKDGIEIEDYNANLTYHYKEKVSLFSSTTRRRFLLSKISRLRFEIVFSYNREGKLEKIIDSTQREFFVTYYANGLLKSVFTFNHYYNKEKDLVRYKYSEDKKLLKAIDSIGQETQYGYDGALLIEKINANGAKQFWKYEEKSEDPKCIERGYDTKILNEKFTFAKGKTIVTDALGAKTVHTISGGQIIQTTDALGNSESWEFNIDNEIIRYTDKMGLHTYYGYDDYGNQTSIRLPNGATSQFIYENNRLTMAKNPNDAVWIWEYDERGLLTSKIGPDGDVSNFKYKDDLLIKIVESNGSEIDLSYDKRGRVEKMTMENGREVAWKYNKNGQVEQVAGSKIKSFFQYDDLGRVKTVDTEDGNHVDFEYDAMDNIVKAKDKYHDVAFSYSPTGRMLSRSENNTEIQFLYDKNDQLLSITNEHKNIYHFKRDELGNLIEESGYDGLKREYRRNAGGNVEKVITPDHKITNYSYDTLGNISKIIHDDKSEELFTYDKNGLLIEAANIHGNVRLERDALGRVLKEYQNDICIESTYDRQGQRTNITSSLGANIEVTRDKQGDIVHTSATQQESKWEVGYLRNELGLELERTLPGGLRSQWLYDSSGRPKRHSVSVHEKMSIKKSYHWDVNNRLTAIIDELQNKEVLFHHDAFGNLAYGTYDRFKQIYKLPDEVGNLFKTPEKKDRKYGEAGQLLKDEKFKYKYDAIGNLIEKSNLFEKWKYHWNQKGMLGEVVRPDGAKVSFTYDALGRRLTKTFGEETTYFVWNGDVPIHQWTCKTEETTRSINENGELQQEIPKDLITWVFEEGTFVPIAKLQNEQSYSIITDYLGTPTAAYDKNGQKVWSCELDIYGKVRSIEGKRSFIPFRYQGQYHDHETGLYYNRFRYYCTDIGTFISQDPIGLAGGMPNMYSYVSDVGAYLDPLGLFETLTIVRVFTENSQTGVHYYAYFTNSKGKSMFTHLSGDDLGTKIVTKENTMVNLDEIADENKRVIRVNKKGKNKKKMIENAIKSIVESGQFNQKVWDMDAGIDCFRYLQRLIEKINPSVHVHGDDFYNRFDKLPNQCK
ncbi:RHS repeat-associated core domain-containing protein [Aureivirga marina]|uniref:RHS repeat-associated core domain-containing protein n=1 Tax=Aureivirga marina TaxID=1182451 RepID=UPI0018CB3949|nr:RHS repeat-associated core domain-containing protein [Aureivirga marina]